MRLLRAALGLALVVCMAGPAFAEPKQWEEVGRSTIPLHYYQGMTHDESGNRYFSGHVGLFRTDPTLKETGANYDVLAELHATENYNHIGDLDYYDGKLYLPLECYYFVPGQANTCKTASIAIADPETLTIDYYVKLDPAEISKAMWCAVSPDGELLWTQEGNDLLAYDMDDLTAEHAAPTAAPIQAVQKLVNAVPPSGISGTTFVDNKTMFAAGGVNEDGRDNDGAEIYEIDLHKGTYEFQLKVNFVGEAEGLDDDYDLKTGDELPGSLHFMVQPYNDEWYPTNGVTNGTVYHFEHG